MAPPLLTDPYNPYVATEQAEDPATTLVPLLKEAQLHKLDAWAANKETARREAKARLAGAHGAPRP